MSEVISITVSAIALGVTGVILRTAVKTIREASREALSPSAQRALEILTAEIPSETQTVTRPETQIPQQDLIRRVQALRLSSEEARLVANLAAAASLAVDDSRQLQSRLSNASIHLWPQIIRDIHAEAFMRSLTDAVARACQSTGFNRIDVNQGRVVAEDGSGRALVVEVGDDGRLRAEVLGVADGSCKRVVDQFLMALKAQGVKISSFDRKFTAGIPQLVAGRDWIRRRIPKKAPQRDSSSRQARSRPSKKAKLRMGG